MLAFAAVIPVAQCYENSDGGEEGSCMIRLFSVRLERWRVMGATDVHLTACGGGDYVAGFIVSIRSSLPEAGDRS